MQRLSSGSAAEEVGDDSLHSFGDSASFPDGAGGKIRPKLGDTTNAQKISRPDTYKYAVPELDRRKSIDQTAVAARSRRQSSTNWKPADSRNDSLEKDGALQSIVISVGSTPIEKMPDSRLHTRRSKFRNPWSTSLLTLVTTGLAIISLVVILHSFVTRQLDTKGCRMSYMRPAFAKLEDFDTEHTRFASKYSVYLYREVMVDEDTKVHTTAPFWFSLSTNHLL
jgi:GPI inositol-deacylase